MHPFDARELARSLIREHGLAEWAFRFDHARRRFGCCRVSEKLITLSRPLTILNSVEQVKDTLLHEIAHALAPGDGHGEKWKAACRRIGARPVRCYTAGEVASPPRRSAPMRLGCRTCGWWVDRRRVVRRRLICKVCRGVVVYQMKQTGEIRSLGFE